MLPHYLKKTKKQRDAETQRAKVASYPTSEQEPKQFGYAKQKGDKTPTKDKIRAANSAKPKWLKAAKAADKFVRFKLKGKAANLLDVAESTGPAPKTLMARKMKEAEPLYRALRTFNWDLISKAHNPESKKLKHEWEVKTGSYALPKLRLGIGFIGKNNEKPSLLNSTLAGSRAVDYNPDPKKDLKVRREAEAVSVSRGIKHPADEKHYRGR
jgi:hypothetical protein